MDKIFNKRQKQHVIVSTVALTPQRNEHGDHAHHDNEERPYRFVSLDELIADFYRDVQALAGRRIK